MVNFGEAQRVVWCCECLCMLITIVVVYYIRELYSLPSKFIPFVKRSFLSVVVTCGGGVVVVRTAAQQNKCL